MACAVDYTSLLTQNQRLNMIPPGVLVSDIQPNSVAERANLKYGDVVTHVNQQAVTSPAAFYQAITKRKDRSN